MTIKKNQQTFINKWQLMKDTLIGFIFGFAILHPVSMVIFRWLDPCFANGMRDVVNDTYLATALYAFNPSMFYAGLAYGLLTSLIATVNSYQRLTIKTQRDILKDHNEQLIKLEQAKRRNTQFLVHDMKTHLGCILGFADLLLDQESEQRTQEATRALERIRRQAHVMKDNIIELLDFERLQETGKIHKEEVSIPNLLSLATEDFSLPEHETQVIIGKKVKDCPPVWADKRLLVRVLTNLIGNAIKHNSRNTHVLLEAEKQKDNSAVLFSCIDEGQGIPTEMLTSVFEDFRSNQQGKGQSSGLGLAFCKAAVEAHGGKIWCESNERKGTHFYFTIPTQKEI